MDNPKAAARLVAGIHEKARLLRRFPDMGYRYRQAEEGEIRILLYGHYRIAYLHRQLAGRVDILGQGSLPFFQSGKTTSGLGTINSNVIRSAPIPLPSVTEQQCLIDDLAGVQQAAASKRAEAQTLRTSAWATFESALFQEQPWAN